MRPTRNDPIIPVIIVIATIGLPPVLRLSLFPETKGENMDKSIAPRAPPKDPCTQLILSYQRLYCTTELTVLYGGIMFIVYRQCSRDI